MPKPKKEPKNLGKLDAEAFRQHLRFSGGKRITDFFRDLDDSGDGKLKKKEFGKGVKALGWLDATKEEIDDVWEWVDVNGDGEVPFKELDRRLRAEPTAEEIAEKARRDAERAAKAAKAAKAEEEAKRVERKAAQKKDSSRPSTGGGKEALHFETTPYWMKDYPGTTKFVVGADAHFTLPTQAAHGHPSIVDEQSKIELERRLMREHDEHDEEERQRHIAAARQPHWYRSKDPLRLETTHPEMTSGMATESKNAPPPPKPTAPIDLTSHVEGSWATINDHSAAADDAHDAAAAAAAAAGSGSGSGAAAGAPSWASLFGGGGDGPLVSGTGSRYHETSGGGSRASSPARPPVGSPEWYPTQADPDIARMAAAAEEEGKMETAATLRAKEMKRQTYDEISARKALDKKRKEAARNAARRVAMLAEEEPLPTRTPEPPNWANFSKHERERHEELKRENELRADEAAAAIETMRLRYLEASGALRMGIHGTASPRNEVVDTVALVEHSPLQWIQECLFGVPPPSATTSPTPRKKSKLKSPKKKNGGSGGATSPKSSPKQSPKPSSSPIKSSPKPKAASSSFSSSSPSPPPKTPKAHIMPRFMEKRDEDERIDTLLAAASDAQRR